jgi:hypothetical protein
MDYIEMPWARQLRLIAYKNIVHGVIDVFTIVTCYLIDDFPAPGLLIVRLLTMHLLFNCTFVDAWYFAWMRARDSENSDSSSNLDKRRDRVLNRNQRENFVMHWARRQKKDIASVLYLFH